MHIRALLSKFENHGHDEGGNVRGQLAPAIAQHGVSARSTKPLETYLGQLFGAGIVERKDKFTPAGQDMQGIQ